MQILHKNNTHCINLQVHVQFLCKTQISPPSFSKLSTWHSRAHTVYTQVCANAGALNSSCQQAKVRQIHRQYFHNCHSMQCFPGDLHRDPGFCEANALQQPPRLAPSRAGLLQDRGGLPAPAGTPRACACACACPQQHPAPLMSATGAAQDAAAAPAACADGTWSCVAVPRVDPPQRPVEKLLQQLLVCFSIAAQVAGCVQSVLSCSAE